MDIKIPGDRTRAACETCQKFTSATWRYGDLVLDSGEVAHDVMQAYCDVCGASLLVAQQSAYKIRQARQEKDKLRTSVKLTQPLKDLVASKIVELGADPERGTELFLKVFLSSLLRTPEDLERATRDLMAAKGRLLQGRKIVKADVNFPPAMVELLDQLAIRTKSNRSEVMRRALVVSQGRPELEEELRKLSQVS